jgi:hypothetical protein
MNDAPPSTVRLTPAGRQRHLGGSASRTMEMVYRRRGLPSDTYVPTI